MKSVAKLAVLLLTTTAAVPAWAQDTSPAAEAGDVEAIVVTGMRESMKTSVARKKNTMEIVESITADDIGKLPDPNVAETLTRIPGVQGYRYGGEGASPVGEGSGLTIRGLSGQTASRVDGRAYFTAGGREFNIEGAIPGMISGVDVYKNPSAEHIEGGIGGLVNIRTRMPLDFSGLTITGAVSARYNDLAKKVKPEVFALFSDRWQAGDGEMGFLIGANYQESHNRSDSNPGNGGASLRRAIRADSADYLTTAGANQAYAGRSDVWHLANATCTTTPCNDLITTVGQSSHVFQEDIRRVRKGLNAAFQWKPNPDLEFYAQGNYNYYRYDQSYRFLLLNDSRTVQNLVTSPTSLDSGLASRGTSGTIAGQSLVGGTFLGSSLNSLGGHEERPYETWIAATGVKWQATDRLNMKLDLSYVKADQSQDNRSVMLTPKSGVTWDITRDLTTTPDMVAFSGPSLSDPANFVFNNYGNGTNQLWDDKGIAAQFDLQYDFDSSFLKDIKAGLRYSIQKSRYSNYSFGGKNLTTDGEALRLVPTMVNGVLKAPNFIPITSAQDLIGLSPTNWMNGESGYSGGYLVFNPNALQGDNVRDRFPLAGIPSEDSLPENLLARRYAREQSYAGYVMADFAALDDRIRGNAGVRIVKTDLFARAMISQITVDALGNAVTSIIPNTENTSYTDILPSFNITGTLAPDLLLRFGYAKGITRPALGDLNPSIVVNRDTGVGTAGNPNLRPLKADSFDLSLEKYFSGTNYVSAGLFYKDIKGFFNGVEECLTVTSVPAYSGSINNNCAAGEYRITRRVNAEKGNVKGAEFAFQTFFDFLPGVLQHFGASGSYTFLKTKNPVSFTTGGAVVNVPQPFQSKHSWNLAGLYEDDFMSARVVYTYRSDFVLFGVSPNPIDSRYIKGHGILDASLNFNLPHGFALSLNASNILNEAPDRYVGEPGGLATGYERQHYMNGRSFGVGLRYKFGG